MYNQDKTPWGWIGLAIFFAFVIITSNLGGCVFGG